MLPLPPVLCVTWANSWPEFLFRGNRIIPKSDSPGCVKAPHLDTRWTILSGTLLSAVSVFNVQTQRRSLRRALRVWGTTGLEHPWFGVQL